MLIILTVISSEVNPEIWRQGLQCELNFASYLALSGWGEGEAEGGDEFNGGQSGSWVFTKVAQGSESQCPVSRGWLGLLPKNRHRQLRQETGRS